MELPKANGSPASIGVALPGCFKAQVANEYNLGVCFGLVVPTAACTPNALARRTPAVKVVAGFVWCDEPQPTPVRDVPTHIRAPARAMTAAMDDLFFAHRVPAAKSCPQACSLTLNAEARSAVGAYFGVRNALRKRSRQATAPMQTPMTLPISLPAA